MTIRLLSFTDRGEALALRLAEALGGTAARGVPAALWAAQGFAEAEALIFVGAAGIAVRSIAPLLKSKAGDPAVVVVDEAGRFAVPLLSGHLGGANALARRIAALCGAQAVITTATDIEGKFAVDEWARLQGLALLEPERILPLSARVLRGGTITVTSDWPIAGDCPDCVLPAADGMVRLSLRVDGSGALHLVPQIGALGLGCKKGVSSEQIEAVFRDFLAENQLSARCIVRVSTIDRKAEEPGLLAFCREHGWPLTFYSAEALSRAEGEFTASAFVQETVGVDNVCERSAVLGSGGALICPKYARGGVTMALAVQPFAPDWRWQYE